MTITIRQGDCRDILATMVDQSVHCCVTSPPYFGLRDYGHHGQIGLEATPDAYVAEMVAVFRQVRRVLHDDGTLWLNLGDSYAGGGNATLTPCGEYHIQPGEVCDICGRSWDVANRRPGNPDMNSGASNRNGCGPVLGLKAKNLIGIPWRVAFALQADGWYLRQDIIWSKPNPMPESVTDRCTKAHEYIFLMSKSARYFYDAAAIAEDAIGPAGGNIKPTKGAGQDMMRTRNGLHLAQARAREAGGFETRNKRSVWEVTSQPFAEAHFATFPPDLIEPCIKAGCPIGGTVMDPFGGAGTTGLVADRLGRNAILIEISAEYAAMSEQRIQKDAGMFSDVSLE